MKGRGWQAAGAVGADAGAVRSVEGERNIPEIYRLTISMASSRPRGSLEDESLGSLGSHSPALCPFVPLGLSLIESQNSENVEHTDGDDEHSQSAASSDSEKAQT